jgi:hypothetical protein
VRGRLILLLVDVDRHWNLDNMVLLDIDGNLANYRLYLYDFILVYRAHYLLVSLNLNTDLL